MRLSQIRCPIPIVRTTAALLLTVALAACSANGKLASPSTNSDTGGGGAGRRRRGRQWHDHSDPDCYRNGNPAGSDPGRHFDDHLDEHERDSLRSQRLLVRHGTGEQCDGVTTAALTTVGTYTYALTCTGPGGSGSGSQQIFVGAVSAPTVNLTITPSAIQPGDSATITWSATNSTSCTASGGTGSDGWNGTLATQNATGLNTGAIATAGQYSYDLTCSGPGGSGSASQNLTVATSARRRRPPLRSAPIQPCWRRADRSRSPGLPPMRRHARRPVAPVATTGLTSGHQHRHRSGSARDRGQLYLHSDLHRHGWHEQPERQCHRQLRARRHRSLRSMSASAPRPLRRASRLC